MVFDKKEYRKNRTAGIRGQGDKPKSLTIPVPKGTKIPPTTKQVGRYALRKNTKRARKAIA